MPIYNLPAYFQDIADAIRSKQPAPSSSNAKTAEEYQALFMAHTGYGIDTTSHIATSLINRNFRKYFVKMKNSSDEPYLLMVEGDYTRNNPTLQDVVVANSGTSVSVTNLMPSSVTSWATAIWYHLKNGAWGDNNYGDEAMIDPNQSTLISNMQLDGEPFTNEIPPVVNKYTPDQFAGLIRNL